MKTRLKKQRKVPGVVFEMEMHSAASRSPDILVLQFPSQGRGILCVGEVEV